MKKIYLFNVIIFLAAFLLFQIEIIIAKLFLPQFGGSYLVWGACVVFFQCILLLGYWFSHLAITKLGINRYRYIHLLLIFLPLLFFPGRALPNILSHQYTPLVFDIFGQLLLSIGLVFFVLATISIIFQSWLSSSELPQKANPYVLYAVSNLGSFLALLSYPLFFESYLDLTQQLNLWRILYLVLAALHVIIFFWVKVSAGPIQITQDSCHIGTREKLRWFLFSASSAIAFLSVTNIITYEVAPVPLLWIIPLCIYLVSFIFIFRKRPYCPLWVRDKFHLVSAFSILIFFFTQQRIFPFLFEAAAYCLSLFAICMFSANQLYQSRPGHPVGLSSFYLTIAQGGFFGGILVTWIAPLALVMMNEYLLSLLFIYLALTIAKRRESLGAYCFRLLIYLVLLLFFYPMAFRKYNIFGITLIFFIFKFIFGEVKEKPQVILLSLLGAFVLAPFAEPLWKDRYIYGHRNYYGIYRIYFDSGALILLNGTTTHGAQYLAGKQQNEPLTYYHRNTPVGRLIESNIFKFQNIGVIGLGAGTLASYGKKGQDIDFFELDPEMVFVASKFFTYLKNSPAKINSIVGDARINLSSLTNRAYELLVIDAFSGDSVPVHLLTCEAILEYKKHLTKDGIMLFHISNRYLNLEPVLFKNAQALNMFACFSFNKATSPLLLQSSWCAIIPSEETFQELTKELKWSTPRNPRRKIKRPWTDMYYNILSILDLDSLVRSVKNFKPFYW